MKTHFTLVASAALAAMTLIPVMPAAAGGGVQLNFGGPLGAFTARPTGGDSYHPGHSYHAPRPNYAHKNAIAERKAAARRAKIAEARQLEAKRRLAAKKAEELARRKAVAAAQAEVEQRAQKLAAKKKAEDRAQKSAAAKRSEDKIEVAKAEVSQINPAEKVEKIETAEIVEVAPVKAPAITAANTLIPVVAAESKTAGDEVQLKTIDVETKGEPNIKVAAAQQVDNSSPAMKESNEPLSCKKFVPSAGLTITVPCGN